MKKSPDVVLIAGPTASGKSRYALDVARRLGGVIINADSMQIYSALQILSARPGDADMAEAPHRLYGHVAPDQTYSVGHWLKQVERELADARNAGRVPIFVGGTGLYFSALEGGIAEMPEVPGNIRDHWRNQQQQQGQGLHQILQNMDPFAAAVLRPTDNQRIVRALEIFEATGKSITWWQKQRGRPLIAAETSVERILLMPVRAELHQRIGFRAEWMMENGAIDEVKKLLDLRLSDDALILKAIGVRQIVEFLDGSLSQSGTIEKIKIATRQYAKRQCTWFRHQLGDDWNVIE